MKRIYSVMVIKGVMEYVEVHAGGPQSAIRQAERIAMKRPPRASAARIPYPLALAICEAFEKDDAADREFMELVVGEL